MASLGTVDQGLTLYNAIVKRSSRTSKFFKTVSIYDNSASTLLFVTFQTCRFWETCLMIARQPSFRSKHDAQLLVPSPHNKTVACGRCRLLKSQRLVTRNNYCWPVDSIVSHSAKQHLGCFTKRSTVSTWLSKWGDRQSFWSNLPSLRQIVSRIVTAIVSPAKLLLSCKEMRLHCQGHDIHKTQPMLGYNRERRSPKRYHLVQITVAVQNSVTWVHLHRPFPEFNMVQKVTEILREIAFYVN